MRIALIGLGDAGLNIHLPALAAMRSVTVVGVTDRNQDRRDRAAATCQAPAFADFDAMLAEGRPDAVVIGTPPDSHSAYAIRALGAGAHVLCEKPFVSSLAEADAVLDAASRAGRQVAINHEFREMPIFRAVRDALRRPGAAELGVLQMWQLMDMPPHAESGWRGQMARRTLFEAGVHLVDLAMALFAEKPVSVQASMYADRAPAMDAVAAVTLEFSGGRLAQLTQNRLCRGEMQYFEVRADTADQSLRASFGGRARLSAGLFRGTRPHARFEFGRSGIAWTEVRHRRRLLARNPDAPMVAATRLVFEETFAAFTTGTEPPTSGLRAREVLEVILACYDSAETGRRIRLNEPGHAPSVSRHPGQ